MLVKLVKNTVLNGTHCLSNYYTDIYNYFLHHLITTSINFHGGPFK